MILYLGDVRMQQTSTLLQCSNLALPLVSLHTSLASHIFSSPPLLNVLVVLALSWYSPWSSIPCLFAISRQGWALNTSVELHLTVLPEVYLNNTKAVASSACLPCLCSHNWLSQDESVFLLSARCACPTKALQVYKICPRDAHGNIPLPSRDVSQGLGRSCYSSTLWSSCFPSSSNQTPMLRWHLETPLAGQHVKEIVYDGGRYSDFTSETAHPLACYLGN